MTDFATKTTTIEDAKLEKATTTGSKSSKTIRNLPIVGMVVTTEGWQEEKEHA